MKPAGTSPGSKERVETAARSAGVLSHSPRSRSCRRKPRGRAGPVLQEVGLIDEQVNRIRLIVARLLQFARPAEFAGYVEQAEVNAVLGDCVVLVKHLLREPEYLRDGDASAETVSF